jgi:hypothetical protein
MSLETNFGIRQRRRPLIPLYRPNDVISGLTAIVSAVIGAISGTSAAAVSGVIIGGVLISSTAIAYGVVIAAVIGLTVWSMTAGGKSGSSSGGALGLGAGTHAIEQNGQLVNTRQSSKVLLVVYGIYRVGGNWVFSRPSSSNNNILNAVITWGEGDIEGLAPAIDFTPLYSGNALNDIHTGGAYVPSDSCSCYGQYGRTACQTCDVAHY